MTLSYEDFMEFEMEMQVVRKSTGSFANAQQAIDFYNSDGPDEFELTINQRLSYLQEAVEMAADIQSY